MAEDNKRKIHIEDADEAAEKAAGEAETEEAADEASEGDGSEKEPEEKAKIQLIRCVFDPFDV